VSSSVERAREIVYKNQEKTLLLAIIAKDCCISSQARYFSENYTKMQCMAWEFSYSSKIPLKNWQIQHFQPSTKGNLEMGS
jgi:hypothetical protein